MTYNKEEYILHNGKKISVIYDDHSKIENLRGFQNLIL